MPAIRQQADGVTIDLLVQPRASRARIGPMHDDRIKISVTAPPVEGAANRAVVELLARRLGCPRRDVTVLHGESSKRKTVRVVGVSLADVEEALR